MTFHTVCPVTDSSQIGESRRTAHQLCLAAGLEPSMIGETAVVVTELATNLVKYAVGGQLLMRADNRNGFEVLALDKGPGMNVARCLQDGYSTGGTPGNGLGAIQRFSTEFDMYSTPDHGTVVFSRLRVKDPQASAINGRLQWGAICLRMPSESVSGDAWCLKIQADSLSVMISDGLGHGIDASSASQIAVNIFESEGTVNPKIFIEKANRAMVGSRGAAIACGLLRFSDSQFQYAGVGNISGSLLSTDKSRGLMSHNGTVGGQMRTLQQLSYEWPSGSTLVMHSDGLMTRWNLADYLGLSLRHPSVLAGVLIRDFNRDRDDITVIVVKRM